MHDTMPTAPGVPVIGYLSNGRPVYRIAGGDGTEGSGTTGQGEGGTDGGTVATADAPQAGQEGASGAQEGAGAPADAPSGQSGAAGQEGAAAQQGGEGDISKLPAFAQKIIRELRGENAGHRTKARDAEGKVTEAEAKHQATLDAIAKAAGLKPDDGPPDPAKLTEQLKAEAAATQAAQVEAAAARIELRVYRAATDLGANAKKLLDSRTFCDRVDALDPKDDADFATLVEAEIKAALDADPSLRANAAAQPKPPKPRSGGEMPGGPGGSGPITEDALRKMTPDQIAKAYAEGRLKHLM